MPRKLTRWSQFVAMGMAQLAGRCSLRDIVSNLSAQSRKLYHLGVGEVSRSSLARVSAEKPGELYRDLFGALLVRCRPASPGHGFRDRDGRQGADIKVARDRLQRHFTSHSMFMAKDPRSSPSLGI